jgi:hypothetical protein
MKLFEDLPSQNTPFTAENLNQIQDNLVVVSATEPTGDNREKVWMQKTNNAQKIYVLNNGKYEEFIKNEDTGWVNLTLESGVTVSSVNGINQTPQYRKVGNHVFIRGHVSTTWDGTNVVKVAKLPFSPPKNIYKFTTLNGASIARIYADSLGFLVIEWIKYIPDGANQTTAKTWLSLDIDYWID